MAESRERTSLTTPLTEVAEAGPEPAISKPASGMRTTLLAITKRLSFRRISAVYIFAALFIIFSFWIPNTFLLSGTWRSLLDTQALTTIAAIGLVIPVAAGAFDLAVGTEVGVGAIFVAWLMSNAGLPMWPAIVIALAGGGLVGLVSGLLVTRVKIGSFIATLGVSSVLTALISWISGDQSILNLPQSFQNLGTNQIIGLELPFWIMLGVALAASYILDATPIGRRVYATGGNSEAARLAGVKTSRIVVGSLVACGAITALAGILNSATLGAGDPTIGPPYLLPAFSAVFLGSTQFRDGRFNVWGTVVASYVLAVGVKGLQLAGAPTWVPDLFDGVALLLAVGLAQLQSRSGQRHALVRLLRLGAARSSQE